MLIKICGIKYRDNLQEIIKLKPDFLGFNFYPVSPRFIDKNLTPGDLAVIPRSIRKAGIFVNQDEYEVSGIKWKYGLDYVQLHGNESPEMCRELNSTGIKVIKSFGISENFDFNKLTEYLPCCDYFIFDTPSARFGGTGFSFNWYLLDKYDLGHPFLLSGGIGPQDAERIRNLSFLSLAGIDINSRFETEPGRKDIQSLKIFINAIRRKYE
jgi:phosphoribosylanthranilate isomerase